MRKYFLSLTVLGVLVGCAHHAPVATTSPSPASRTIASSSTQCPQAETEFVNLAHAYDACNSSIRSDQASCDSFCGKAQSLTGIAAPPQTVNVCSQVELDRARQIGQQEVMKDLSVRFIMQGPTVWGTSETDCRSRAIQQLSNLRIQAINGCNQQAVVIRNCESTNDPKVSVAQGRAPSIQGDGRIEVKYDNSDDVTCVRDAVTQATQNALNACRAATGFDCTIAVGDPITQARRDKPLIGAAKRICKATVYAQAPADVVYKCSAQIEAVNRARSGGY